MDAPPESEQVQREDNGGAVDVNLTGSGSIPEPVTTELEDKLDAAFASSEPDSWHEPIYLEPTQPRDGDTD